MSARPLLQFLLLCKANLSTVNSSFCWVTIVVITLPEFIGLLWGGYLVCEGVDKLYMTKWNDGQTAEGDCSL